MQHGFGSSEHGGVTMMRKLQLTIEIRATLFSDHVGFETLKTWLWRLWVPMIYSIWVFFTIDDTWFLWRFLFFSSFLAIIDDVCPSPKYGMSQSPQPPESVPLPESQWWKPQEVFPNKMRLWVSHQIQVNHYESLWNDTVGVYMTCVPLLSPFPYPYVWLLNLILTVDSQT